MRCAEIVLKLKGDTARIVANSLSPEVRREIPRTRTEIYQKGEEMHLKIKAQDTNALRAAVNSYIRWAKVAIESTELVNIKTKNRKG